MDFTHPELTPAMGFGHFGFGGILLGVGGYALDEQNWKKRKEKEKEVQILKKKYLS